jgi:CelD/BcsL family acetyltransferase involved in cellulose biosynthesis
VRGELLALEDIGAADLDRWRELAARAAEPNPFFEPDYVLPLARGTGRLGDVALAVVRDGGDWAACLPVRCGGRWHRVPLPSVSSWRAHRLYALLGTPLIDAGALAPAAEALAARLATGSRPACFVGLDWLAEHGAVHHALTGAFASLGLRTLVFDRFERAFLRRRPEPTYLEQTVSVKHRRELRRQWRVLGETLGEEPVVVDRAGDAGAVAELIELEARSALAAGGSVLAANPDHARFFADMCRGFADRGRLELLALRSAGNTLAMKCNLLAGEGVFYLKIAYDERYARYSPGIQLEAATVERFHARSQASWIDSCADANNAMINRLWPDRRAILTIAAVAPTIRGLPAAPALLAARSLRNRRIEGRHDRPAA